MQIIDRESLEMHHFVIPVFFFQKMVDFPWPEAWWPQPQQEGDVEGGDQVGANGQRQQQQQPLCDVP